MEKKPRVLLSYKKLGEGRGEGSALRQEGGGELVLRRALCWVHDSLLVLLLQECTNVFSKGGGEELAKYAGVPFLGEWPLEQSPSHRGDARVVLWGYWGGWAVPGSPWGWSEMRCGSWFSSRSRGR